MAEHNRCLKIINEIWIKFFPYFILYYLTVFQTVCKIHFEKVGFMLKNTIIMQICEWTLELLSYLFFKQASPLN